jgi:hypothetical protein
MSTNLIKRAGELDQMRSKGIADKLTFEEAQNIVTIWGTHLEHSGGLRIVFGGDIPESLLPYPIDILQGALKKMEAYYFSQGLQDKVRLLEETEILLVQYANDKEAMHESGERFGDKKWQEAFSESLYNYQLNQADNGFLIDKKLWKLSKSRIEELERE